MTEQDPFSLRGKVIVLCGGSGLLGTALTQALSDRNAELIITSREVSNLAPIIATARKHGRIVWAERADPANEDSMLELRDRVLKVHQRVDGLVYNAVARTMKGMDDDLSLWEESMATNATGAFNTLRTFGDAIAQSGGGSIVTIASMQGIIGMSPWLYKGTTMGAAPDYFFHKAGLINLTRYLASYYGPSKVRVNAVAPGGIWNAQKPQAEKFLSRFAKMTALGRMGRPEEMTGAVVFL